MMNKEILLNTINSKEYDFLRNDKSLGKNIGLLTLGGSYSYGTNIDTEAHTSDLDLRGFYINSPQEILSMKYEEKPFENRDLDVVIYPLKMVTNLLSKCNPNVLEILGTREQDIAIITKAGKLLKDNSELFLSQLAYGSFGGYACQQLRRLENGLAKGHYSPIEKERHILKSLESKLINFEQKFSDFNKNSIKLYINDSEKEDITKEIYMNISLNNFPIRDFKEIQDEMSTILRDFDKLNHRNRKKDETHLYKHAMHLIRLLLTGTEILKGKGINTYRGNDRDLLLDIRNGKYTYKQIFEMADELERKFNYAYKNTSLPRNVDKDKINELIVEINKEQLKSYL